MNTKDIPCIKTKCILLPVCKSKIRIHCDDLFYYTDKLRVKDYNSLWIYIRSILPNIQGVNHSKLPYGLGVSIHSSENGPVKIIHKEPTI